MAMTAEETRRLERELIERGGRDLSALKDAFELSRTIDDHERSNEIRKLAREHLQKPGRFEDAMDLYHKTLMYDGPVDFDCFMRALEFNRPTREQFWLPRRQKLMPVCRALQDMEDGKLDELFLSCPPRIGKSTLMMMFFLWVMGRDSERSNLYCSYTDSVVGVLYNGILEVLNDKVTYLYKDIFPGKTVASTNAKDLLINLDRRKRYASFTGRSLYGTLNGACDCNGYLVGDDLISGIEEAMSKDRLNAAWMKVDNNMLPRAKETAKVLWIGTRWSLLDPQGKRIDLLENDPKYRERRWKVLNTPALDENGESNFEYLYGVGFSTDYYQQRRASFERNSDMASWLAQYMGEPIERDGAVFDPADLRYYNGVRPEQEPDRTFIIVDPSWGGGDYVAAITVQQYGNDLLIPAVVFSNEDKTVTQPMIVAMAEKYKATAMKVEGTKMTASYGEDIDHRLREKGIRINIAINTSHFTGTGKRDRIIARAPDIRERMLFLGEGYRPKEYSQFMQNVYSFTFNGKMKHDDAPDVLAMGIDYVTVGTVAKAEVMQRPW
ncbi:MAG: hypothetical protein IKO00_12480 [Oscillospiraceae bacterium]|nr:hypothetical protein [Oscillospiraceae bacterium]